MRESLRNRFRLLSLSRSLALPLSRAPLLFLSLSESARSLSLTRFVKLTLSPHSFSLALSLSHYHIILMFACASFTHDMYRPFAMHVPQCSYLWHERPKNWSTQTCMHTTKLCSNPDCTFFLLALALFLHHHFRLTPSSWSGGSE